MLFGKSSGKGTQNPQGSADSVPQTAAGYGAPQTASPWQSAGGTPLAGSYPTQQTGTGYAGYTPGAENSAGAGYAQGNGASAFGQGGYGQPGAYPQNAAVWPRQNPNSYAGPGYGAAAGGYPQTGYPQAGPRYGAPNAAGTGGYPNAGQAYGNQSAVQGYGNQGAGQGYGTPGMQGQGYGNQNAGGYPRAGQPYAGQNAYGYSQGLSGAGYPPQASAGYTYPQMAAGQGNYTQGQQGYVQSGYGGAYAQMGRNQPPQPGPQQEYGSQIPLNGGGYVPQPVPVKKQPFVFNDGLLIILSAMLLALFAAGLFVPSARALLWLFLALAAGSAAFFWAKPVVSGNRRLCYTIVFGVLSLVALVTVLGIGGGGRSPSNGGGQAAATVTPGKDNSVVDTQTGNTVAPVDQNQSTPTPAPSADTSAQERVETFFRYWMSNMQDEMLALCAPSWQSSVDNPKAALFGLLANRKPTDYYVEGLSGTDDSTSRKATVTSTIDRNNGKDPVKYRLSVLMLTEGDQWFVDPQSLKTYEEAETPDPATLPTPTVTAPPPADANTILYYNPDGGSKYHLDQNCKSTHAKYLPMKGHFKYSEINSDKYKNLSPCNVCAAPLRP